MRKIELLAPAGDRERLEAAVNYGADAVYFAGKKYGLRAFGSNFELDEISDSVKYCHEHNVKVYITVNILAHNEDLVGLVDYLKYLESCQVDGVIVADLGIATLVKANTNLELHVSTQANVTNVESAKAWIALGAKRLVLARELSITEIKQIREAIGDDIDIECFCHGAMCISYSGRCLLSNYFTGRDSNKGECAQPCRWEYQIKSLYKQTEVEGDFPIQEDERGTYILNSKDMCLIEHIKELIDAGITSFKIEGRMKSTYYVATVVNAYRRVIDAVLEGKDVDFDKVYEVQKTSHRKFTTGFYFGSAEKTNNETSKTVQNYTFVALCTSDIENGYVQVSIRNKIVVGDKLEVLSPTETFNKIVTISEILDKDKKVVEFAAMSEVPYFLKVDLPLKKNDMLRKEN